MAESTVRTVKQFLRNTCTPDLYLHSYCATPLTWCDKSPSELLMGRKVRTDVPQTDYLIIPDWQLPGKETRSIEEKL